jgi:hypothetical protein
MENFANAGDTNYATIYAPSGGTFTGGSIKKLYACGDLNSSSEYFNVYIDGQKVGGNYNTGYQDCTWRQAGSNIGISSYISGKSSFQLKVVSSSRVNHSGNWPCPNTAMKVKFCFGLSTGPTPTPTIIGQLHSSGQNLEQVALIPSSFQAFGFDSTPGRLLPPTTSHATSLTRTATLTSGTSRGWRLTGGRPAREKAL